jgi:bla regulator protein BlaR1
VPDVPLIPEVPDVPSTPDVPEVPLVPAATDVEMAISSVEGLVVIEIFDPATRVRVSVGPSATTSPCPATDMVLNASVAPPPAFKAKDAVTAFATAPITLLPATAPEITLPPLPITICPLVGPLNST